MNTPTLTIKEFIEKLNNKNQIEEENKDTQKTNEKIKLKIKLNTKLNTYNTKSDAFRSKSD